MLKNRNVGFYYGMEITVMLDNPSSKKVNDYENTRSLFILFFMLNIVHNPLQSGLVFQTFLRTN